jgi:ketosteroid isomerase-like protein
LANWILDLTHAERVPDRLPRYEGLEGWKEFWNIWIAQFDTPSFEAEGFYDAGDRVVAVTRQRAVAKASRVPAEQVNPVIYTLRDGLITRLTIFNRSVAEALKAVGLEE